MSIFRHIPNKEPDNSNPDNKSPLQDPDPPHENTTLGTKTLNPTTHSATRAPLANWALVRGFILSYHSD